MGTRKTPGRRKASAKRGTVYETGLDRRAANYVPLTPISFLARSAEVYADKPVVRRHD